MKKFMRIISTIVLLMIFIGGIYFLYYKKQALIIHTTAGEITYQVEKAMTVEEQRQGLMHRKHLPQKHGMLFLFRPPRIARMWMKNTLIPLDMLFFDRSGRVIYVHKGAIPQDETIISSGFPVAGVLEINAGEAEKYGIKTGAKLELSNIQ